MVRQVLDHYTSRHGTAKEAVVFPATSLLLTEGRGCNIPSTALLTTRTGTVWFMKSAGHAWTRRRVERAAELLVGSEREGVRPIELRKRLALELEMRSLVLVERMSQQLEGDQWGTDALCAIPSLPTRVSAVPHVVRDVNASAAEILTNVMRRLFESLDPEARLIASREGVLDIWTYNYLIHAKHGQYRRQFAKTFPFLLSAVVRATRDEPENRLRKAVDGGAPLVDELAALWGVAPRVARHLIGKTPALIGERWVGNGLGLARILDALPQEYLPGKTFEQWARFNEAVGCVQELTGRLAWESAAALAWLRKSAPYWMNGSTPAGQSMLERTKVIDVVNRLQEALAYALELELDNRISGRTRTTDRYAIDVADKAMCSLLKKGKLIRAAESFDAQIKRHTKQTNLESMVLLGHSCWPLFPGEFISSGAARRVVALTETEQFREHGEALSICLWWSTVYLLRCSKGISFVLAFFDASSGQPRSTAEIGLVRNVFERRWGFNVVQHTGSGNKPVSDECAQALREVLRYCEHADVQRHLERGLQLIRNIELRGIAWAQRQTDLAQLAPALRVSLGNAFYDTAIRRACASVISPPPTTR